MPRIENLNGQNVNQMYNEAWLSNRNAELTGMPRFSHVEFTKPIEIKVCQGHRYTCLTNDCKTIFLGIVEWNGHRLSRLSLR